ncbi:hypothetical protein ARMSODRAFT_981016 [Armillaria solidipes]|uniref:Uncharacterized protein n=1 Tax=Armillaria solidipes TaxID=1076256 RepID=A0A2H3BG53_9AGAR|nr:hypothetical protein ARMSODRAFT_981016 [Armillaria solidipes]
MSTLFLCSGCHNMDLASEPVARCLGMSFRMHIIETPSLEHKFVDYYPRLDEGITFPDPGNNCIRGLIFHQYRAAPQVVPLKFVFRQDDNGEIVDCIPHVNGFFPPAQLAYRRVGGRGSDPPFELWYYKNQMQLGIECPDSANDTIVSLSCSLELNKSWYGSVVAVMLEKTEGRKRYTNVQYHHLSLFGRFFRSSMSPCTVY